MDASIEDELVHRAQAGDRAAFSDLVRLLEADVIHFAYYLHSDRDRAEDLAQEAFVEAFRRLAYLRDASQLRPWVRGIVRNLHRARRRQEEREPRTVDVTEADLAALPGEAPEEELFAGLGPDEIFERIAAAIESLPEPYRSTLLLRHYRKMSCRAIAKELSIPTGTVTMRLSRGHRLVREAIVRRLGRTWRS